MSSGGGEGGRPAPPLRPLVRRAERRALVDLAWERFSAGEGSPDGVRDEIARSWLRCRDAHRIDPLAVRPGPVLDDDALAARRDADPVFPFAAPILADFARRLGLGEAVLAYADGEGWLLWIDGDPAVAEQAAQVDFRAGALWSEEAAGTNAPGTALAEGAPVEVFASEHYVEACRRWSCAAAPILAPGDPRPVGAVDITARWEVQRRHALVIAKAIARSIEERLRAVHGVRDEVVRYALRAASAAGEPMVAVDAGGRVLAATEPAGRCDLLRGAALAPAAAAAAIATLRSPAASIDAEVRVESPEGCTVVASPVRYGEAILGAILRVAGPAPVRLARGDVRASARGEAPAARAAPDAPAPSGRGPERLQDARRRSERDALLRALEGSGWNVAQAAARLGISRMTLYRRLRRHGIALARPSAPSPARAAGDQRHSFETCRGTCRRL